MAAFENGFQFLDKIMPVLEILKLCIEMYAQSVKLLRN